MLSVTALLFPIDTTSDEEVEDGTDGPDVILPLGRMAVVVLRGQEDHVYAAKLASMVFSERVCEEHEFDSRDVDVGPFPGEPFGHRDELRSQVLKDDAFRVEILDLGQEHVGDPPYFAHHE